LFRFIKRSEITRTRSITTRIIAILLGLLVSGLVTSVMGINPIKLYKSLAIGSFGSSLNINATIVEAIPLCLSALGISVAFRMQFWNIGGEGQMMMGAFGAALVALKCPNLPMPIMLIAMAISGILFGGVWALIPAFFKAKWRTNETILTLMLNYIAIKWVTYLQYGPWKDPNAFGFPKIANFVDNAILPNLFGVNIGWIITLVMVAAIHIFIKHTKLGYEIAIVGESEKTAKYAGVNITKTIIMAIIVSGGLSGLAGMIQASAIQNTLSVSVTGGLGFTAIIVAWLSNLSAPIILIVSVLFAGLVQGGNYIQSSLQIPGAVTQILQAIILFFALGSEFFIRFKAVVNKPKEHIVSQKDGESA
jgi:general nucleoside transport system permease protein